MKNNLLIKTLLPTVEKALTEENITQVYNKACMKYPIIGDKNICTISKKSDGKVYLSVVSIANNEITKVHDQRQIRQFLQEIIFNIK